MQTPKAFTVPRGPDGEKAVWTLAAGTVKRNGDFTFDLASITGVALHRATVRGDSHRMTIMAAGERYVFSSSPVSGVDTDGWQWFVVTLLRRTHAVLPDLRVDVTTMRSDPGHLILGVLVLAIGLSAAVFWLTSTTADRSDAAAVLGPMLVVACLVAGSTLVVRNTPPGKARSSATPDEAADLAVERFKRRYRH